MIKPFVHSFREKDCDRFQDLALKEELCLNFIEAYCTNPEEAKKKIERERKWYRLYNPMSKFLDEALRNHMLKKHGIQASCLPSVSEGYLRLSVLCMLDIPFVEYAYCLLGEILSEDN